MQLGANEVHQALGRRGKRKGATVRVRVLDEDANYVLVFERAAKLFEGA